MINVGDTVVIKKPILLIKYAIPLGEIGIVKMVNYDSVWKYWISIPNVNILVFQEDEVELIPSQVINSKLFKLIEKI